MFPCVLGQFLYRWGEMGLFHHCVAHGAGSFPSWCRPVPPKLVCATLSMSPPRQPCRSSSATQSVPALPFLLLAGVNTTCWPHQWLGGWAGPPWLGSAGDLGHCFPPPECTEVGLTQGSFLPTQHAICVSLDCMYISFSF